MKTLPEQQRVHTPVALRRLLQNPVPHSQAGKSMLLLTGAHKRFLFGIQGHLPGRQAIQLPMRYNTLI